MQVTPESHRPSLLRLLLRGFGKKCPSCGQGSLYQRYLKPTSACSHCGEAYDHIRTDDFAPWLTLIVLGHIFVPLIMPIEARWHPPIPVLVAIIVPAITLGMLVALPHFKGTAIALMWHLGLRGDERQ